MSDEETFFLPYRGRCIASSSTLPSTGTRTPTFHQPEAVGVSATAVSAVVLVSSTRHMWIARETLSTLVPVRQQAGTRPSPGRLRRTVVASRSRRMTMTFSSVPRRDPGKSPHSLGRETVNLLGRRTHSLPPSVWTVEPLLLRMWSRSVRGWISWKLY